MHKHIVGLFGSQLGGELVTIPGIKEHIDQQLRFAALWNSDNVLGVTRTFRVFSLADYCDTGKQTDLQRFNYCPICGYEIPWETIPNEDNPEWS